MLVCDGGDEAISTRESKEVESAVWGIRKTVTNQMNTQGPAVTRVRKESREEHAHSQDSRIVVVVKGLEGKREEEEMSGRGRLWQEMLGDRWRMEMGGEFFFLGSG